MLGVGVFALRACLSAKRDASSKPSCCTDRFATVLRADMPGRALKVLVSPKDPSTQRTAMAVLHYDTMTPKVNTDSMAPPFAITRPPFADER